MKTKKQNNKLFFPLVGCAMAIVLAIIIAGNILAFGLFAGVLESYFGVTGALVTNFDENQYYEREYDSYSEAAAESARLAEEIEGEGAVLMKNEDNSLPLSSGDQVSIFSVSSVDFIYGSIGGSGEVAAEGVLDIKEALTEVGLGVNDTLWEFYQSKSDTYQRVTGGLAANQGADNEPKNWAINEVPQREYTTEVIQSYSSYNDAAIVVLSRTGSENGDLPRDLSQWSVDSSVTADPSLNSGSILELEVNEIEMLSAVCEAFDNVIILLNTSNAMELGFMENGVCGNGVVKNYENIKSCLWVGGLGQYGMQAVADIIAGNVNPSGKLVDTYAYDAFSSPAMQNFGSFAYNGSHNYVTYAEGIYVGYKYYETRYEDYVTGRSNVGDYDYATTVQYPFGYGLSYTTFEWSNFTVELDTGEPLDSSDDVIKGSVTIKNTGKVDGKEVVEIYYQSPYTRYDERNGVEKASVNLAAFEKTEIIPAGEEVVVEFEFALSDMKSYDMSNTANDGEGAYLLEAARSNQQYFVTAARDAHQAVNNILLLKAQNGDTDVDASLMSGDGDAALASCDFNFNEAVYDTDSATGNTIDNLFTEADGNTYYNQRITYLSRSDWEEMDNDGLRHGNLSGSNGDGATYKSSFRSSDLRDALNAADSNSRGEEAYAASGTPETSDDFTMPVTGSSGDMNLIELKDKDFDDPAWEELLNQVTVSEMVQVAKLSGYKTAAVTSVNKPLAVDADGPSAWNSYIGDGVSSGGFPYTVVVASTWNTDLAYRMGEIMGELALWSRIENETNLVGWYAPAMNIHRTPFGGRNFEYYSEDAVITADMGSATVKGATEKGVICYIKHFALNEQETNRMTSNVVWAQEQAMREIYFRPFEDSIKEGGSLGLMTAYNRIGTVWTGGSYSLITELLRNEWGFNGFVITDYMDGDYENPDQMLAAGGDAALNVVDNRYVTSNTAQARTYLRRSMHHLLYAFVNSNGMNGIDGYTGISGGTPNYYYIMIGINIVLGLLFIGGGVLITLSVSKICKAKKQLSEQTDKE